jgi:hypothetical protein
MLRLTGLWTCGQHKRVANMSTATTADTEDWPSVRRKESSLPKTGPTVIKIAHRFHRGGEKKSGACSWTNESLPSDAGLVAIATDLFLGKHYTTLNNIAEMRRLCRVQARGHDSGSVRQGAKGRKDHRRICLDHQRRRKAYRHRMPCGPGWGCLEGVGRRDSGARMSPRTPCADEEIE